MVATAAQMNDEQAQITYLHEVFAKQKAAYAKAPYPSAKQRRDDLDKLAAILREYKDELAEAMNTDFSCRSKDETLLAEIMVTLEGIKYNRKNLKKWMKPSRRHVSALFAPASNKVHYQPKGVVGIMVPWNYPIQLAAAPLAAALAAGNRAVIKLSEFTPATNAVMQRMFASAFDEDQVAIVLGEAQVGAEFSNLHWDHLLFTGSTAVARHVMSAAGKNLVPVTLELGGKSPCIITDKGTLKSAAESIIFGKATNAGQTCIAPDYILCPSHSVEELKSEIKAAYQKSFPTLRNNNDYTAIVNERQFNRLQSYLKDAEEKGATIEPLNHANEDFSGTRKIPLTLVTNTTEDMVIMQDEIFGPLLPILSYDNLDDALQYINEHPRPLALYLFSHNGYEHEYVLRNTHAGGVAINDCLTHIAQDDMPFGGVGDSGIGAYHGHEGFLSLSHAKSVHKKGRFNSGKFIHAPHGRLVHRLIYKFIIR
ncbi:MAG: coniferyl aldehyde dehydrogenase [Gammaproteobacteria bacterium]|nr:coniferyl aldehyde dehydrogenase [Gammaproteobacteria bacterium]